MPQLDSGEFGWAEDTENLYIGKRIVDGAISDENTRILTENDLDNVFSLLVNTTTNNTYYKYRNQASWIHSVATTVQTKLDASVSLVDYGVVPLISTPIPLTINRASSTGTYTLYVSTTTGIVPQLGYIVSGTNIVVNTTITSVARDFSIGIGSSSTGVIYTGSQITIYPPSSTQLIDITNQFQAAVNDLFANTIAPTDAIRELEIPAGTYAINNAINLPPYTTLKGAGAGITNLVLTNSSTHLFRTVGLDNTGVQYTYEGGSGNLSSAFRPKNIRIEGMTLSYQNTLTTKALLTIDNAKNVLIKDMVFMSTSTTQSAGIGVAIRGQGGSYALSRINDGFTQNIEIRDCEFTGMQIGVRGTGTVVRAIIDGNNFNTLEQGVSFYTTDSFPGPSDGVVTKNRFHNIKKEAFYVGPNPGSFRSNHISDHNFYGYVGNGSGFNDFVTTSTTFYPVYINAATTSGSGVNTFVVNTVTYTAFKNIDVSKAYWYATTSTVNGVYSQFTGTVVKTATTLQFTTTSSQRSTDYSITGTVVTFGYIETATPAINFQSAGNRTENDVFARKVLADQGPGAIVESINVLNVGSMGPYATTATITISPPDLITGVPATAYPIVDGGGTITAVVVTNPGYGYLAVPTITASGLTSGTPAQFRLNLVDKFWYIPYVQGQVTINDTSNYLLTASPGSSSDLSCKFPITGSEQNISVNYQLSSQSLSRHGVLSLNIAGDGYVTLTENYNYLTNVVTIGKAITPVGPSGVDVLYVSSASTFVSQIPSPPTNYFIVGTGKYDGLAATIVSTGTVTLGGTQYFVIQTNSTNPSFDYATPGLTYTIGFSEATQPIFTASKNVSNNYVKMNIFNPSVVTTATLEYQVSIQQL
jgi:hypothetical protein